VQQGERGRDLREGEIGRCKFFNYYSEFNVQQAR